MSTDPLSNMPRTPDALERNPALPPEVYASPVDLPRTPSDAIDPDFLLRFRDEQIPFWRPSISYLARSIGWRWVFLLPAFCIVIGLPLGLSFRPGAARFLAIHIVFLWIFANAVVISILQESIKHGVRRREEPFCIHCGYNLEGLGIEGKCPECGRFFRRSLIDEFRKDPEFFAHRCAKAKSHPPAFVFAAGLGPTPDDGTC